MTAKPYMRARAPDLTGLAPSDEITRAQLVALLARHAPRKRTDDERDVRNKISSKVSYHVKRGKLCRTPSNRFRLGEVAAWAMQEWPGSFESLFKDLTKGVGAGTLPVPKGVGSGHMVPRSLEEAESEIRALHVQILTLAAKLAVAESEMRELKRDATKWRGFVNKKRGPRR